jgi:SecD/SecF fusion protein
MTDRQRHGFILLLVAGLIAASVVVLFSMKTYLGLDLKGGVELVYQGEPTPQSGVTPAAMARAVDIMRNRVDQLGVSEPEISTYGGNQISVGLPNVHDTRQAINEVGNTARLEFYDWEANVLLPNGKTVASLGPTISSNTSAVNLSQGSGGAAPGSPGAGSMNLYDAVKLASKQPPLSNAACHAANCARAGPLYYMFGAPGSRACTIAGKALGYTPLPGEHCMLTPLPDSSRSGVLQAAASEGIASSQGQVLAVPQGTVVLQATPASFANPPKITNPATQFYVLRDHVSLFGSDITNPTESTDQSGAPDVSFGFTSHGKNAFQSVTAAIARRGAQISSITQPLNQHFAVALDQLLVTVPSIDFKTYPDGIPGDTGADITGGFTSTSANNLANELRLGALPIKLNLISQSQVSASLGHQALHDGLIAGAAGLGAVILFLLSYYRILGLIATAALATYALYFYALIKLIPVTLTLSGIAGLILTIGVAADANIVIFERVKEEIRAGRSIRQGIAIGYRKGLTAIIDANVVTILTAFILFVVATSDVKGFALTLGIGTFVSLFTAVMATQAVLMTMGSSRAISRPSMLGAGGAKRAWRFDFMGASKYFFSMSGVILLVGALAVGGKGLNLGIDFTGGTRISVALERPATQAQISSIVSAAGAGSASVQKVVGSKTLGPNGFQISGKLDPSKVQQVENSLNSKFGIPNRNGTPQVDVSSIGSTFGSTIENAAVIAIIASLLVISVYVALRFEWKFAVPVLIALMHDLLITSGVYALTGRQVTVDTVAALLTILGYSLYDTIIVFDRVRENIPRMPRAAFSQIVNRSMSEVLTRSLATTSCTLMPIVALLIFGGGGVLGDFAFALLIGVASGAYSSIFIASPVLTHWKEREQAYRSRRRRIIEDNGFVPAYATVAADVEPPKPKRLGRAGRLTQPEPETVSAAEFEQMKRDLEVERELPTRQTSTLTKRLARTEEEQTAAVRKPKSRDRGGRRAAEAGDGRAAEAERTPDGRAAEADRTPDGRAAEAERTPDGRAVDADRTPDGPPAPAPDIAENEGVAPVQKPKQPRSKSRPRRRHGRRR